MTPTRDPLDDPGEGIPANPARRRIAMAAGILALIFILAVLAWFAANNTETADERGPLLGWQQLAVGASV